MKVKCINAKDFTYLTLGKIYEVLNPYSFDSSYDIINDNGGLCVASKSRFTVEEQDKERYLLVKALRQLADSIEKSSTRSEQSLEESERIREIRKLFSTGHFGIDYLKSKDKE